MAQCTQCGVIMHDDDAETHVCDILDLPEKGKPIKFSKKVV